MANPYTKSHQAGQHQAWLEGLRAGVALAKETAGVQYMGGHGCGDCDTTVGWRYTEEELELTEEACK